MGTRCRRPNDKLSPSSNRIRAAVARLNTRHYRQDALHHKEALCIADISRVINPAGPFRETLYLIAQQVSATLGYLGVSIWLRDPILGVPITEVAYGLGVDYVEEANRVVTRVTPTGRWPVKEALESRKPVVLENLATDPTYADLLKGLAAKAGFNSLVGVPLVVQDQAIGAMACYAVGPHQFASSEVRLLVTVANQVAIFVENAHLYRELRELAVMAERVRIAHDLHDWIIQAIYATSLNLEGCLDLVDENPTETRLRLSEAVDSLGEIRTDIRRFVMDLRREFLTERDLPDGLAQVVREFSVSSSAKVEFLVERDVSVGLTRDQVYHLMGIAREALANVSKHAQANKVRFALDRVGENLVLTIEDDGIGFDAQSQQLPRGFGLESIESRVKEINGQLSLTSSPDQGTRLVVHLPCGGTKMEALMQSP